MADISPRPTKRRRTVDPAPESAEDELADTIVVQPRSSGRERKRPKRFSPDPEDFQNTHSTTKKQGKSTRLKTQDERIADIASPQPKGILTPSGRKKTGLRKSVVFDEGQKSIEQDLGFRDIETSASKLRKGSSKKKNKDNASKNVLPQADRNIVSGDYDVPDSGLEIETIAENAIDLPSISSHKDIEDGKIDFTQDPYAEIKSVVLLRITSSATSQLAQLETQYETTLNILSSAVVSGESNSLLLLGARGSGKSMLINACLDKLRSSHGEDFHIIRLNGFFQTDDKLALRDIWRQLGREMEVPEDEYGEVSSYADTMTSLLSLLSHPDDLQDTSAMQVDGAQITSKSIVFVLDEFDLFTTHPRQTLLYNLFDIAQSRKAPIAVVGCSTRMDVVECLEKRVKSRFSHRWLHIPSFKTLITFEEAIVNVLTMTEKKSDLFRGSAVGHEELETWNNYIRKVFLPSAPMQTLIKQTFHNTRSLPEALINLYPAIVNLSIPPDRLNSTSENKLSFPSASVNSPPSLLTILQDLPTIHLSLLIAAARLESIHDVIASNFNIVYSQYHDLMARSRLQRSANGTIATGAGLKSWSKELCRDVWEQLAAWDFMVPVSGAANSVGSGNSVAGVTGQKGEEVGGENAAARMFRVDVTLDEIAWAVKEKFGSVGPGEVLGKWCREI